MPIQLASASPAIEDHDVDKKKERKRGRNLRKEQGT